MSSNKKSKRQPTAKKPKGQPTVLVALNDLATVAGKHGCTDIAREVYSLIDKIKDFKYMQEAESLYQMHKYGKLRFTMVATYNDNPAALAIINGLSNGALRLYSILQIFAISQEFSISRNDAAALIGQPKNPCRAKTYIDELVEKKALYVVRERTNKEPPIYRFSTALLRSGKYKPEEQDIKDIIGCDINDLKNPCIDELENVTMSMGQMINYITVNGIDKVVGTASYYDNDGHKHTYMRFVPKPPEPVKKDNKEKESSTSDAIQQPEMTTHNNTYPDDNTLTYQKSSSFFDNDEYTDYLFHLAEAYKQVQDEELIDEYEYN